MCKVLKDYGAVADHGSKVLKLQLIKDAGEDTLSLVSYKDGMSVANRNLSKEDATKLFNLLSAYLDYKPEIKAKPVESKADDKTTLEIGSIVHSLSTLPATDGNYRSALKNASEDELKEAIDFMEKSGGRHSTRINACKGELDKRESEIIGQRLIKEYNAKQKTKTEKSNETESEKPKKHEVEIISFPTEDKKPEIIKLTTAGRHTYEECEAKLKNETKDLTDSDNEYVINGLLEYCNVDTNFCNNFMREDKSYLGFMNYMFDAASNGYCFETNSNRGRGGILDRDRALGLAIDYYNHDEEKQKAIEEEERKKKAEERKKSEVKTQSKVKPKRTYKKKETVDSVLQMK